MVQKALIALELISIPIILLVIYFFLIVPVTTRMTELQTSQIRLEEKIDAVLISVYTSKE